MPAAKPPTQTKRKRTRKRKRRAASSSSSSSSSSDSSSSEDEQDNRTVPLPAQKATELTSSDSESKSSSSSNSSDDETARRRPREPIAVTKDSEMQPSRPSLSPSPPPTELPSFLPPKGANSTENTQIKEQEMKLKFRQFWMSSVAEGFRDDLEEIRKACLSLQMTENC
jgi:ribosome assembly protein 3